MFDNFSTTAYLQNYFDNFAIFGVQFLKNTYKYILVYMVTKLKTVFLYHFISGFKSILFDIISL